MITGKTYFFFFLVLVSQQVRAQDPAFSQFFASPLNINPALTANINADWRLVSNLRDQWIGPASPYMTGTVSFDGKFGGSRMPHIAEDNYFGGGSMLMFDYAMAGVVKSIYASANGSYNIRLMEGYRHSHRLSAGFGVIFGRRYIDYSRVDFEAQFAGNGFNTNLPTGETALSNMKPYFSASAGLVYSIRSESSNFDIGAAGFHLNKPRQTFMNDENQNLATRKVIHSNYERLLNDRVVLNINGIFQQQAGAGYFSFGSALGYRLLDENSTIINGGIWYWSDNAVIPYIGIGYRNFQFGLSHDITVSKLSQATRKPNTWELSLILRGIKDPNGIIPCPWK